MITAIEARKHTLAQLEAAERSKLVTDLANLERHVMRRAGEGSFWVRHPVEALCGSLPSTVDALTKLGYTVDVSRARRGVERCLIISWGAAHP